VEEYQTIIPAEKPMVKHNQKSNPQISEICYLTKYKPVFVDVDTNVYNNWLRPFSVLMHTGPETGTLCNKI
jgi:hypothetical protein